jgi:solute carrier family 41
MIVLAGIGRLLFDLDSTAFNAILLFGSLALGFLWLMLVRRNGAVKGLVWSCWPPVIGAILICSLAGLAFERFVRYFEGLGLILTVANGISGNAASILAARFATSLQIEGTPDRRRNRAAQLSIILLCTPIHMLFLLFLHLAHLGHTSVSLAYTIGHLLASNFQLLGILWVVPRLVQAIWRRGLDPDSYTMPLLAAITDFGGTTIFIAAFSILWLLGDRDANVGT